MIDIFKELGSYFCPAKPVKKESTIGELIKLFRDTYTTDQVSKSLSLQDLYRYLTRLQAIHNDSYVPQPGKEYRHLIYVYLGIELPANNPF